MKSLLDCIVDAIERGDDVTLIVLDDVPCRFPQRKATSGYTAGCRCRRCTDGHAAYVRSRQVAPPTEPGGAPGGPAASHPAAGPPTTEPDDDGEPHRFVTAPSPDVPQPPVELPKPDEDAA